MKYLVEICLHVTFSPSPLQLCQALSTTEKSHVFGPCVCSFAGLSAVDLFTCKVVHGCYSWSHMAATCSRFGGQIVCSPVLGSRSLIDDSYHACARMMSSVWTDFVSIENMVLVALWLLMWCCYPMT